MRTRSEAWLDTEDRYVEREIAYDGFGNVVSQTDPTGRTSSITYDATDNTFPETTTNAAGDTTSGTWDLICGVQTTSTDVNGQTTTTAFDALCRPVETLVPGGAYERKYYLDMEDPGNQSVVTETPAADGSADLLSAVYLDGLGRVKR